MKQPRIKKNPAPPVQEGTMVINQMPIILRNVDRTTKNVGDWWDALQIAERVTYPSRTRLYDLYKHIIVDAHLSGIIEKRIASIINKDVCFKKDGEEVEEMEVVTESPEFRKLLRELMLQKFWGISGMEFLPGPKLEFNCIPRKHIKPEKGIIVRQQEDQTGSDYRDVWNMWVVGDPSDYGILLKCAPLVLWKKGIMGDWAQYIEIFGQPFVVGKYNGFDTKTKNELDVALRNFGGSNRMMVPNEAGIEVIDGKTSNGNGDLQDKFRQACNEELSVLVLGATETTTSSDSSGYAQAKTHGKQQDIILKADMIDIMDLLNCDHFLNILRSYGLPVDGGHFEFEQEVDLQEVQSRLNIASQVKKLAPVADDYIYEVSNIPKPENYDELKNQPPPNPQNPNDPDNPDNPDPDSPDPKADPKKAEKEDDLKAMLKGLSFWQKIKAVFSEAP